MSVLLLLGNKLWGFKKEYRERILAMTLQRLGPQHPDLPTSYNNLAL